MSGQQWVKIEPLSKENYDTWKLQIEALLVKTDNWDYVSGKLKRPSVIENDANSAKAADTWDAADRKARSDLILSISPSELQEIKHCKTSNEIWKKLKETYQSKGPARKATLLKRLTLHKMAEGADARDHVREFFETVSKLNEMDVEINKDLLAIMLLYSLPASFENFRVAIESRDDLPSPDVLKVKILEESEARGTKRGNVQGAMFARNFNQHKYTKKNSKNDDSKKSENAAENFKFKCYKCRKPGHKVTNCPQNNARESKSQSNAEKSKEISAYSPCVEEKAMINADLGDINAWCLDSGCTSHMCGESEKFREIGNSDKTYLHLADKTSTSIAGVGKVKTVFNNGSDIKTVNLENTLHVPELRTSLLSVGKFADKDWRIIFEKTGASIENELGEVVLRANRECGGLYYICESPEIAGVVTDTKGSTTAKTQLNDWHRRLGHINFQFIKKLSSKNLIDLKIAPSEKLDPCSVCLKGKFSRLPFKSVSEKSSDLLDIVHTDLCGPMRVSSMSGTLYFATFIDDKSRWCEVKFLKSKDEVFSAFKSYKNLVEKQTGKKIRNLQSDNGGEYISGDFEKFLDEEGIKRRLTVPHTPQQNGVAERKNRSLLEASRCLMIESGLPPSFWAEAISTANYIKNRTPSNSLNMETPFKVWKGRDPNLKYFKPFGIKGVALDKTPGKGKFDPRGRECVFIGYSEKSKGYRVWIPSERKIEATRDVIFIENLSPKDQQEEFIDQSLLRKMNLFNRNEDNSTN